MVYLNLREYFFSCSVSYPVNIREPVSASELNTTRRIPHAAWDLQHYLVQVVAARVSRAASELIRMLRTEITRSRHTPRRLTERGAHLLRTSTRIR